ncbi:DMT family transporter [Bacteroidota bacterium]
MNSQSKLLSKFIPWFMLIILAIIWGSSFILMKKGLVSLTPGEIGGIRILSAAVFLIPVSLPIIRKIKRKHWIYLFISGFLGSLIPSVLFPIAQTRIDSGIAGVLNALTPLFTILVGASYFHSKFTLRTVIGIFIGFVGSIVLITAGSVGSWWNINIYALLIVLATFFYGINVNLIKYYLGDMRPAHITSISMLIVSPFAFIYLLVQSDITSKIYNDPQVWIPLFYVILLGVVGTALALILFNRMLKITNTVFASSVTYLIPIVAVIWGLIDNEVLLFNHYLGMAGIIVGVLIANLSEKH